MKLEGGSLKMIRTLPFVLALLLSVVVARAHAQTAKASVDGLTPFQPLIGIWKGEWQYSQAGQLSIRSPRRHHAVRRSERQSRRPNGRRVLRVACVRHKKGLAGRVPGEMTVQVKDLTLDKAK
jgi:hypothetical protein